MEPGSGRRAGRVERVRVWSLVAEMIAAHGRCALVTVAAVRGSAPREPGARMVVAPDGGFRGTIGGGELEWRAIGFARDALSRDAPSATLDRFTLGPDLGQCCGGSVRLLTEVFGRSRLDEARELAAREAAGPFVTRGRIGPRGVERRVLDDVPPQVLDATGTDRDAMSRLTSVAALPGALAAHGTDRDALSLPVAAAVLPDALAADGTDPSVSDPTVRFAPIAGDAERGSRRTGRGAGRGAGGARACGPVVLEGDGLIVERFRDPRRAVWLFGAGHVGRALMLALAPLPFAVTWIDERAEVFPAAVPANVHPVPSADPAGEVARAPAGALVVVMTHSHARDLAVVHAALEAGRFGYVGLIGSESKRARFTRRLREAGVAPVRIADLVCPIGCPGIASKHPAAIAASVAVQLLGRDEALTTAATPVRGVVAGAAR